MWVIDGSSNEPPCTADQRQRSEVLRSVFTTATAGSRSNCPMLIERRAITLSIATAKIIKPIISSTGSHPSRGARGHACYSWLFSEMMHSVQRVPAAGGCVKRIVVSRGRRPERPEVGRALPSSRRHAHRRPPGPRGVPLLGMMPALRRNPTAVFVDVARSFGDVAYVRIGRGAAFSSRTPTTSGTSCRTTRATITRARCTTSSGCRSGTACSRARMRTGCDSGAWRNRPFTGSVSRRWRPSWRTL